MQGTAHVSCLVMSFAYPWSIRISGFELEDNAKPGKGIQTFLAGSPITALLKYQSVKQLSEMSCNVL